MYIQGVCFTMYIPPLGSSNTWQGDDVRTNQPCAGLTAPHVRLLKSCARKKKCLQQLTRWKIRSAHLTPKAMNKYNKYNLNFHPLEVVSRYRDPQLQVGEENRAYSYLFNLRPNICKSWFPDTFHSENQWFDLLIKQTKGDCRSA